MTYPVTLCGLEALVSAQLRESYLRQRQTVYGLGPELNAAAVSMCRSLAMIGAIDPYASVEVIVGGQGATVRAFLKEAVE